LIFYLILESFAKKLVAKKEPKLSLFSSVVYQLMEAGGGDVGERVTVDLVAFVRTEVHLFPCQ
jgi:hypothetical protein